MSIHGPGVPSGSVPTLRCPQLSLPPTGGKPGSNGTLTYSSAGVKTIAEQGASFYACLFDKDCVSTSPPAPPILKRGGASLAQHQAATVLKCWKQRIWLCCWFDQQAQLKQKRLRLQTLCRGTSINARLVRVNRHPPLTPPNKTSNPKALCHHFRTRGQPLPPRKRVQQYNPPRHCPG
jgi:hypothetical protein